MADLARIKNNVAKMASQNAPVEDIDGYIASEGVTVDDVRNFKGAGSSVRVDPDTNQPPGVPAFNPDVPGYNVKTGEIDHTDPVDKVGAFSIGGLRGIPIVGPSVDKASSALAAAMQMPFSDKSFGELYDQNNRYGDAVVRDNPHTATAGSVTGAVAGTLPAMAAAPDAFGIGAASMPAKMLASTITGGTINAADSAIRSGGDPWETTKGGLVGMGTGLAAPILGPLVGKGAKAVADKINLGAVARALGLDKKALSLMADAARRDALDATTPAQLAQLGPDGMLLDLGPNMRHTAAGIASLPGEGKNIVRGAIEARDAGANQRIRGALDQELGPAPIPSRINAGIETNQTALSPEYRTALENSGPVDTLPIARYLDREAQALRGDAQKGIQRIRAMLDHVITPEEIGRARATGAPPPVAGLETNPATLLETRKAVDGMLETVTETNARNALTTARQAIDDELRASVPGIKEVDAKYAELARQREAVGHGQQVLSSGRESPRPAELADEFRQGALPQGMQVGPSAVPVRLREGARAEIERIVGTNANDRVALQRLIKGEGDWNRDRLTTLFGADRTKKIIDLLDREKLFADTSQIVTRNSESAARIAAQDALTGETGRGFGIPQAYMAGGAPGAARAAGYKGVEKVVDALRGLKNEKALSQIATSLTSGGRQSAVLNALMKVNAGSPLQQSQVDRVARALLLSSAERR